MKTNKTILAAVAFLFLGATAYAQNARVGINTTTPATTLDVSGKLNTAGTAIDPVDITGLQAPRLTRAELTNKGNSLYGTSQTGALIYITDISGGDALATSQRKNVDALGYYYFDGSFWQKVGITSAIADTSLGTVAIFPFSNIPTDYLECNGAAVSRTTYAALFAKIGTTYGAGDGSTTFNLPDLRGEFIRGWDNGRGVDASRTLGSFQVGSAQYFNNLDASFNLLYGNPSGLPVYGYDAITSSSGYPASLQTNFLTGGGYSSASSLIPTSTAPNNIGDYWGTARPRNVAMVYAIKAKDNIVLPSNTSAAVTAAAAANEPWFSTTTSTGATSNTENIYQMGKVMVGTATVPTGGTNAKLIVNNGTTNGAIQIKDGTEGAGKVLTSDANGVGKWSSISGKIITAPWPATAVTKTLSTSAPVYSGLSISLPYAGNWLIKSTIMIRNTGTVYGWGGITLSSSSSSVSSTGFTLVNTGLAGIGISGVLMPSSITTYGYNTVQGDMYINVTAPTTIYIWFRQVFSSSGSTFTWDSTDWENVVYAMSTN